jgi:hypothetical protein
VAIGAFLGRLGVVERQRALMGNAAGLPLVIVVESPEPTEVVNRFIEMNLVTSRAEFRCILTMEGFEETLFMWLRI